MGRIVGVCYRVELKLDKAVRQTQTHSWREKDPRGIDLAPSGRDKDPLRDERRKR